MLELWFCEVYCCSFDCSYGINASGPFQKLFLFFTAWCWQANCLLLFSASSFYVLSCCAGFHSVLFISFWHSVPKSLIIPGLHSGTTLHVFFLLTPEFLNQHMSWGVFHDLFKFGLKLWVMPQKAILAQRFEKGIIIKQKKLFTICCNEMILVIEAGCLWEQQASPIPIGASNSLCFCESEPKNVISNCWSVLMQMPKVTFCQYGPLQPKYYMIRITFLKKKKKNLPAKLLHVQESM